MATLKGGLAHDVSILLDIGRHFGSQPRANTSITIMRPPQRAQGQGSTRGVSVAISGGSCVAAAGGVMEKSPSDSQNDANDPIRKCAAPLADRPHARSWGYSAVARGRSEGVVFGSEHVDRGETRL